MSNAAIRRVATRAVVSAVLFLVQTSLFTQVRSTAPERDHVAQFCSPPDEDGGAPRLYCENSRG
jgi:hypothetical protein